MRTRAFLTLAGCAFTCRGELFHLQRPVIDAAPVVVEILGLDGLPAVAFLEVQKHSGEDIDIPAVEAGNVCVAPDALGC